MRDLYITVTILKCTVIFSIVTVIHHLIPEYLHSRKKPGQIYSFCLHFFLPHPPAATSLLSVLKDFPILDFSYKWNHAVCSLVVFMRLTNPCICVVAAVPYSFV